MASVPFFIQSSLFRILLLAVVLRVAWALLVPVVPISDSFAYDTFAQTLWLHGTYGWTASEPTSYWPVGTAAIYSGFYTLFGHVYWPIILFNIVCTLVIMLLTSQLCERFFTDKRIGLYVAGLLACWPTLIFYTTILASELPYMACLLAAFCALLQLSPAQVNVRSSNLVWFSLGLCQWACLAGVLFAAAYYIRPLAMVPFVIAVFYLLLYGQSKRQVILGAAVALFIGALLVTPWAYRNYQLYDAYVPMSTNGGATLWMGNQAVTDGGYVPTPPHLDHLDEHARNQQLKQAAIDYIQREPLAFVVRTASKFVKFHGKETIGVTWNGEGIERALGPWALMPLKMLSQAYWTAVLLLALCGLLLFLRRQGFWALALHPFMLLWMSTAAVHSLIVAQDRYHIPVIPFVAAFAVYAVCCGLSHDRLPHDRHRRGGPVSEAQ